VNEDDSDEEGSNEEGMDEEGANEEGMDEEGASEGCNEKINKYAL
jgi:hypothetical protein